MKSRPNLYSLFGIFFLLIFSQPGTPGLAILHDNRHPVLTPGDESLYASCNGYLRLQKALRKYKEIASQGGWSAVTKGASLKEGDKEERVIELRKRLIVTGDLFSEETREEDIFDEKLHHAVIRFQKRHGLKEDGVVGSETIKSLNVSVEERIRQIEIN
ncbi:MAG: peptidoglycan-binding protein [Nitrospirae bacterium]|nr:peptidoglycan-binding protein [Nitrospirota bacterium]